MLYLIMLSVVALSVVELSIIMVIVIMVSMVVPFKVLWKLVFWHSPLSITVKNVALRLSKTLGIIPSTAMLVVIIMCVSMLTVIELSVIMMSVVAPFQSTLGDRFWQCHKPLSIDSV